MTTLIQPLPFHKAQSGKYQVMCLKGRIDQGIQQVRQRFLCLVGSFGRAINIKSHGPLFHVKGYVSLHTAECVLIDVVVDPPVTVYMCVHGLSPCNHLISTHTIQGEGTRSRVSLSKVTQTSRSALYANTTR